MTNKCIWARAIVLQVFGHKPKQTTLPILIVPYYDAWWTEKGWFPFKGRSENVTTVIRVKNHQSTSICIEVVLIHLVEYMQGYFTERFLPGPSGGPTNSCIAKFRFPFRLSYTWTTPRNDSVSMTTYYSLNFDLSGSLASTLIAGLKCHADIKKQNTESHHWEAWLVCWHKKMSLVIGWQSTVICFFGGVHSNACAKQN